MKLELHLSVSMATTLPLKLRRAQRDCDRTDAMKLDINSNASVVSCKRLQVNSLENHRQISTFSVTSYHSDISVDSGNH